MDAVLIFYNRRDYPDGTIAEEVIWRLAEPVRGSVHHFKYRLFFGRPGQRLIGYDNERGEGDHRHYEGREETYIFSGPRQTLEDFRRDVARWRGDQADADNNL